MELSKYEKMRDSFSRDIVEQASMYEDIAKQIIQDYLTRIKALYLEKKELGYRTAGAFPTIKRMKNNYPWRFYIYWYKTYFVLDEGQKRIRSKNPSAKVHWSFVNTIKLKTDKQGHVSLAQLRKIAKSTEELELMLETEQKLQAVRSQMKDLLDLNKLGIKTFNNGFIRAKDYFK